MVCPPFKLNLCFAKLNVHCSWCMLLGVANKSILMNQKIPLYVYNIREWLMVTKQRMLLLQANKRLSQAEKELAKAFDHARGVAERRSQKEEL